MTLRDYMYQEKKVEEDLPVLETVLTHQYNGLKITYKITEKDWLQPPETIMSTRGPTERQLSENKNGKKNNFMNVLSN